MLALMLAALQGVSIPVERQPARDTLRPAADSVAVATAYQDGGARELVRLARTHRGVIDGSVFRYTATSRQRISVGLRALRRDRLLYRRETATRIDWRRDATSQVEVLGAREAIPIALGGVRVPDDLDSWAREFVPRPGDDRLFVNPTGGGFAWHPLVEGGEALYRYATGDTTVIRLPGGRQVRLVELRVTPRERDVRVVTGSFWIEMENHAIVQAVFRPARDFDLERDGGEFASDVDEVPGVLKPIRFDVRYITVEYGLWEMRWWMPRLMAFDGSLRVGVVTFPINMEMTYADYQVEPDRYGLPELPPVIRQLAGDPESRPRPYRHRTEVIVPDTAVLLHSPALPRSIYAAGDRLITESELRELVERLNVLPPAPWEPGRPELALPWQLGAGLVRYNRVEGLSAGARIRWDLGRGQLDLTGRLGSGDREPNVELGADLPGLWRTWRVAGYHRLEPANPAARPFQIANSTGALLFGRDEGMYFRASGAEVRIKPAPGEARYAVRLYAEQQRSAPRTTDFSARHALDRSHAFRPNIAADRATQVGVAARVGIDRGLDPTGYRWGAWLDATAEAGSYTFVRPGVMLLAGGPLPGPLLWATEAGAGTTAGRGGGVAAAPVQSHWFLGGPATLRGFPGGSVSGPDHVRGRIEVANRLPAARLALFSDAGWAGTFDAFQPRELSISAGVGASLLDGLVRLDLARAVRPAGGWRLEMYIDGLF